MNANKWTGLLLAGAMLLTPISVFPAKAEDGQDYTEGEFYSWSYKNYGDHIELTKLDYTGQVIINIPDEIDGIPVTEIGPNAVGAGIYIKEVHVPEGVEKIGWLAFGGAPALETVTLPSTLDTIEDKAFSGCDALKNVELAGGVRSIGDGAFRNCSALESITLPEGTQELGTGCFYGCESLAEISFPDSIRTIHCGASSMENLFGDTAWYEAQPDGVLYLGKFAVGYKGVQNSASDVVIKDGTLGIAEGAFRYQSKITTLDIPDSVRYINANAFPGEPELTEVHLPHDLETIEVDSFSKLPKVESFTIDEDAPHFTMIDGVLYDKDVTTVAFVPSGLEKVHLPDSVVNVPARAFAGCSAAEITLPDGITGIGDYTFSGCKNLRNIAIPDSVTSIGEGAFRGCTSLQHIRLPKQLQTVGQVAFSDCTALRELIYPDTVTELGSQAMYGCTALRKVRMPAGITEYPSERIEICYQQPPEEYDAPYVEPEPEYMGLFYKCDSLETLILPNTLQTVGAGTFQEPLRDIWYAGTAEEWAQVGIEQPNLLPTMHFGYDETSALSGDITLDNAFSVTDAVYLQRYLLGDFSLNEAAFRNADLNGDGEVDVFDLGFLKHRLLS